MPETTLPVRTLGRTDMPVTRLGYGTVELRNARPEARRVTDTVAVELLNAVLDAGITFIDTSPDYGLAEEMVGRAIAHRRDEYYLASKVGCPVGNDGAGHTYTRENVIACVEQSLRRMRTDYLDLVQFHGRPVLAELQRNGAIEALQELKRAGTQAARAGAGTVIRGGAARGAPADDKQFNVTALGLSEDQARGTWERAGLDGLLDGASRMEFTLRFTLSHPELDTAIVGTSRVEHLHDNVAALLKGPLPTDVYREALRRLDAVAS